MPRRLVPTWGPAMPRLRLDLDRRPTLHCRSGAVVDSPGGLRYRPVLALIAATGLRRGEALALHWEHVNLKDGTLRVAATLSGSMASC